MLLTQSSGKLRGPRGDGIAAVISAEAQADSSKTTAGLLAGSAGSMAIHQ